MNSEIDLLLLGCGSMGAALAVGYQARNPAARVVAVAPSTARAKALIGETTSIEVIESLQSYPDATPSVLIVALKPQAIPMALPPLASHAGTGGLVISVAAGITTHELQSMLPRARIIRAMPNTPALISKGVTGLFASARITGADRALCEAIFGSVGATYWVDREDLLNAVTAVSGSGPAYVFAVAEAFVKAAVAVGLSHDLALSLTTETIRGAAEMIATSKAPLSELKQAVRSPQGTTDAALRVLEKDEALNALFLAAIDAATRRSQELAGAP